MASEIVNGFKLVQDKGHWWGLPKKKFQIL
jgi:hypothetical protein